MKVIHRYDCTWCRHRKIFKKAIDGRYDLERCGLTGKDIPSPKQSLLRRCDSYQQSDCPCQECNG